VFCKTSRFGPHAFGILPIPISIGRFMSAQEDESRLRERIAALERERDLLQERVKELEEALQGCLSRSRH